MFNGTGTTGVEKPTLSLQQLDEFRKELPETPIFPLVRTSNLAPKTNAAGDRIGICLPPLPPYYPRGVVYIHPDNISSD